MGLIISTVMLYSIILGIDILGKRKNIKKGQKTNAMDHFVVVIAGNGILAYVCSNSTYTDSMRTIIIALFTVLYVLFWIICIKMNSKNMLNCITK